MMNRKTILLSFAGLFAASLFCGCNNTRSLVEDPTISLNYLMDPSEDNLSNLSKAYGTAINRNRKAGVKQPGLCSDYAITLALLGNQEEANKWFNREVADFPSSRDYVVSLKQIYCPAFVNEASQATDAIVPATSASAANQEDAAVNAVIEENNAQMAGGAKVSTSNGKGDTQKGKSTSKGKKSKKKSKKK
mgnify:CR=1 FL=1